MAGRILSYSYSENTTSYKATHTLRVNLGGGDIDVRHAAPAHFEDVLASWKASLDTAAAAGAPWTVSYSSTTRRVTIARTGGNFTLTLPGNTAEWLGYGAASYTGQGSYTGTTQPAGVVECKGIDVQVAENAHKVDLQRFRHGRALATRWGNARTFWVDVTVRAADATALLTAGYCSTGRLRIIQPSGDTSAYSRTNYDGMVDGFVVATSDLRVLGSDEGYLQMRLLVAQSDDGSSDSPTGFWATLKYGWNPVYFLTVSGIPHVFSETAIGLSLPAGYTSEDGGSLVIDDSSEVGSQVDRETGLGAGLPLTFRLLDTTTVRGLMQRATKDMRLTADFAAAATAATVDDTTGWSNGDAFYISGERCTIGTVASATSLTGITRALSGSVASNHKTAGAGQLLTDKPRAWRGRQVTLWAAPADPSGYITGSSLTAEAVQVWKGRIDTFKHVAHAWEFDCLSLERQLEDDLIGRISGTVLGHAGYVTISKAWEFRIGLKGVSTAGATLFDALTVVRPFDNASYADGDVMTVEKARQAISDAWGVAIDTVTGNGLDVYFDSALTWNGPLVLGPYVKSGLLTLLLTANLERLDVSYPTVGGSLTAPTAYWSVYFQGGMVAPSQVDIHWWSINPLVNKDYNASKSLALVLTEGSASDVPTSGMVRIKNPANTWDTYSYAAKATAGAQVVLSNLVAVSKATGSAEPAAGSAAEIVFSSTGTLDALMLRCLESSGSTLRGTYDTLAQGAGYGIDDDHIHEASFTTQAAQGVLAGLQATTTTAGGSFQGLYGGALALFRLAVVCRPDNNATNKAIKLTCVSTALGGSDHHTTIADKDLITYGGDPVESVEFLRAPNILKVTRLVQDDEGEDDAPIYLNDTASVEMQGPQEQEYSVPAGSLSLLMVVAKIAAPSIFGAEQSMVAVRLRVPPWVAAEIGDVVKINCTHPVLYSWASGAVGLTGFGRVVGKTLRPKAPVVTLTLLADGQLSSYTLSPAMKVTAYAGAANNPTSIDLDDPTGVYYQHVARTLTEAGGNIRLLHYTQGGVETDTQLHEISAASQPVAGTLRVTVASTAGGHSLSTATATPSWLTLPTTNYANTTAYQKQFAHADDGSYWG